MELLLEDESGGGSGDWTWCLVLSELEELVMLLVKYDTGDRLAARLQELDLSTGLLSRDDDLNDGDLDDDVDEGEGMVRLELDVVFDVDDLSLYLGLMRRKLLDDEGLELPDSSSLDCLPLERLKLDPSMSPDLLNDPEPPPGLQEDIFFTHFTQYLVP